MYRLGKGHEGEKGTTKKRYLEHPSLWWKVGKVSRRARNLFAGRGEAEETKKTTSRQHRSTTSGSEKLREKKEEKWKLNKGQFIENRTKGGKGAA